MGDCEYFLEKMGRFAVSQQLCKFVDVFFFYVRKAKLRIARQYQGAQCGGASKTITIPGGTAQNLFDKIAVSGQSNVVADTATDTLTLVAGTNVTITTDDSADSVTINASGGGGRSGPDPVIMGMIF